MNIATNILDEKKNSKIMSAMENDIKTCSLSEGYGLPQIPVILTAQRTINRIRYTIFIV